jgi:hypothetical protein
MFHMCPFVMTHDGFRGYKQPILRIVRDLALLVKNKFQTEISDNSTCGMLVEIDIICVSKKTCYVRW